MLETVIMPVEQARKPATAAPTVSIIMPAYNVAQYIGEALDSVLAQTFTDYEIIVVNDGSPDTEKLEQVLQPYRDRVVYVKHENRGLSGARNTAICTARGSLVALLDPDDVWEPHYLAVQVSMMENDPTIDVLYPNAQLFGDAVDAGREYMEVCPSNGEVTFETLVTLKCNVFISVTARREALVRAGMFDESLRSVEDFDLWLRIIKQGGRIAYHRQVLARYRRRPESLSANPVWMLNHCLRVFEKAERTLNLTPSERQTLNRQQIHFRALLRLFDGKKAFLDGDAVTAVKALGEANAYFKSRKIALTMSLLRRAPRLLLRAYAIRDRFVFRASTKF